MHAAGTIRIQTTFSSQIKFKQCKKYSLEYTGKWYKHILPSVVENEQMKLMQETTILTDNRLKRKTWMDPDRCFGNFGMSVQAKTQRYQDIEGKIG